MSCCKARPPCIFSEGRQNAGQLVAESLLIQDTIVIIERHDDAIGAMQFFEHRLAIVSFSATLSP